MRAVSIRGPMAALLAAVVAIGLTAGCGGGGEQAGSTGGGGSAASSGSAPEEVVIGMPTKLVTVDPDLAINEVDVIGLGLLRGTLTDMPPGAEEAVPALAESCEWTANRLAYRCRLRAGLRFSDGSPLDAKDVEATFKRALTDRANVNAGLSAPIRGVRALSADEVEIQVKAPFASLPAVLSEGPFAIMPAEGIAKGRGFFKDPVFAGPYRIASNSRGDEVVFEVNPNYAGAKPVVPSIVFRSVEDANTRLLQLKSGQLDIAHGLPPQLMPQVTGDAKPYVIRQYGGTYIYMNNRRGPLKDPKVRQAISSAVDRDQLNKIIYNGQNDVIGSFFPSNMVGHDPDAPTARDLDKARELLRGTVCESGCTIPMMVRENFQPYDQMSVVVQQNLADVGIRVPLQTADQSVTSQNEQDGNFDMEVSGLYDVVNVPDAIMLTYGLQSDGGIEALFSGYDSKEMDAAIQEVRVSDGAARDEALAKVNEIFARDMPYVPLLNYAPVIGSSVDPKVVTMGPSGLYDVAREGGAG